MAKGESSTAGARPAAATAAVNSAGATYELPWYDVPLLNYALYLLHLLKLFVHQTPTSAVMPISIFSPQRRLSALNRISMLFPLTTLKGREVPSRAPRRYRRQHRDAGTTQDHRGGW